MLFNYKRFLMNEKIEDKSNGMIYSDGFIDTLKRIDSDISKDILSLNGSKSPITYINTTSKNDFVSFIQSKNIKENPWVSKARQELKVGKFARKLINKDKKYTTKEIEEFVNKFKASYDFEQYVNRFEIVSGSDITKYYHCRNQIYGGQLGKSCMGGSDQERFIESFFETNPETVKMLILRDKDNPNKIVGRSNLWHLTKPYGRIFMDRIYTNQDYLVDIFIQYAKINDYIYKTRQIYGGNVVPVINKGKVENITMNAKMISKDYEYYPYVDTFQFYNRRTGLITNDTKKWDLTVDGGDWISLIHAGGKYFTKDNDGGFKMDYMGRLIHPYYVRFSNVDDCYIHIDDAIYLAYKNDYCTPDRKIVQIDGENFLIEDTIFDNKTKMYKKK